MRLSFVFVCLAAVAACESTPSDQPVEGSKPTSAPTDPYKEDFDRICNAERLSGGDEIDPANRPIHVAQWLGRNVRTQKARDFLAKLAGVSGHDKAAMLEGEAKKLGLTECPLAFTWSGGHSGPPQ